MADSTSDLIPLLDQVRANPIAMQRLMIRRLEAVTAGKVRLVDPTSPFVFLLEAGLTAASMATLRNETLTRRQYPSIATTDEELYLHMTDRDYLNRFATPSRIEISLLLSVEEIKQKAVSVPNTNGVKKLTIPRHTEFMVAETAFTMQYPIEIRVMPHGGMIITYDTEKESPLYLRDSNSVDWFLTSLDGTPYVRMNIPITQFKITSIAAQMNAITGFSKTYTFTDNFYYCRAYQKNNGGVWNEIKTTHTDQVYDPTIPTVALRVLEGQLVVHIPQIYFTNGKIKDVLRIDIYTTKGDIELPLANYTPGAFKAEWLDYDEDNNGYYTKPIYTFSGLAIFSTSTTEGGLPALTFDELRERVITRALSDSGIPITNAQLQTELEDLGYQLVVDVDNITNRQFLATRQIEKPDNDLTYSGAGCTIHPFQATMSYLAGLDTACDNGVRVTLKPTTLYKNTDGVLTIIDDSIVQTWINGPVTQEELVNNVNTNSYLYTPFYYVFDSAGNNFDVRPYQLDKPTVISKYYDMENERAQIESSTKAHELTFDGNQNYQLLVEVKATEGIKNLLLDNLKLQLSYVPPGSSVRVFFEGVLAVGTVGVSPNQKPINDRYIYRFDLNTNLDVNALHHLILTDTSSPTTLTATFDLAIIALDHWPSGAATSDVDLYVNAAAYPGATTVLGLSHEKFTLKFGDYLENLWVRSRSFVDNLSFDTYPADVLAAYGNNVYERDINGNIILTYNVGISEYEYNILHWAGEPVLITAGQTALDNWLLANPTRTSEVIDWIMQLSNADRQTYIINIANIRIAPNSIDIPRASAPGYAAWITANITGPGVTAYNNWLSSNPNSDNNIFDWWNQLTPTEQHDYSVIAHEAGDNILDEFGNPTIANGGARGILRQAEMFFVDGKYYFATDQPTLDYRSEFIAEVVDWVMVDIAGVAKNLIEQSWIFFYPKNNATYLTATVGEGESATLPAEQYLTVTYQVTAEVYDNPTLRDAIADTTIRTLADTLKNSRVAHSTLISKLQATIGDDVLSADIDGLFENKYKVATMKNNSMQPTLGKELKILTNKTLGIKDAVTIVFVRHT